jgi:hypothetical protein
VVVAVAVGDCGGVGVEVVAVAAGDVAVRVGDGVVAAGVGDAVVGLGLADALAVLRLDAEDVACADAVAAAATLHDTV